MILQLLVCPLCGRVVLWSPGVLPAAVRPRCTSDTSELSYVHDVNLPPSIRIPA